MFSTEGVESSKLLTKSVWQSPSRRFRARGLPWEIRGLVDFAGFLVLHEHSQPGVFAIPSGVDFKRKRGNGRRFGVEFDEVVLRGPGREARF